MSIGNSPYSSLARSKDRGEGLADVLERVLDKGVVIAGDISVNLLDIELLTIKIRLLIASADKARELGIDWWSHDPHYSSLAQKEPRKGKDHAAENRQLRERIARLEARLEELSEGGDRLGSADRDESADEEQAAWRARPRT